MNEQQLDGYLNTLDLCASRIVSESESEVSDRIQEVKWILQRIYRQTVISEDTGE